MIDDLETVGFLQVSKTIAKNLGTERVFALRSNGKVFKHNGKSTKEGDYLVCEKTQDIKHDDLVVGRLNSLFILRRCKDMGDRFAMVHLTNEDESPVFIHKDDLDNNFILGKLIQIFHVPATCIAED